MGEGRILSEVCGSWFKFPSKGELRWGFLQMAIAKRGGVMYNKEDIKGWCNYALL